MKDFFISYNSADQQWAEWIASQLEEAGCTTVYMDRDFHPGENFVLGMHEASKNTRSTIIVLTPAYLESEFAQSEWAAAFVKDSKGKKRKLIPVRVAKCEPEGLLSAIIYIDLVGLDKEEARDKLRKKVKQGLRPFRFSDQTFETSPVESHEGREERQQPETFELLNDLANPDPLVCFHAAKYLKGRSDLAAELVGISGGSPVITEAVRKVIGSFPEKSAELLVSAIKNCGPTGETWHRARQASENFAPVHSQFAEEAVVAILRSFAIEKQRHALTALGYMGRLAFYATDVDEVLGLGAFGEYSYDRIDKCFDYALKGSARNFVLADNDQTISIASKLLLHLMNLGEKVKAGPSSLPLGNCTLRHVDKILSTWLEEDSPNIKKLGLRVLARLRVSRSAGKILEVLRKHTDDDVAESASFALWCIGRPEYVKKLMSLGFGIKPEGLLIIDEDSFDLSLPLILDSDTAWMAYRAIGLRKRKDKISLLRDGLLHTSPIVRGSAALALARLDEQYGLKKAYEESDDSDERIFTALAVLRANLIDYDTLEKQLRIDLAERSFNYAIEAQEDILTTLRGCSVGRAEDLAQAWTQFYGRGAINIRVSFL